MTTEPPAYEVPYVRLKLQEAVFDARHSRVTAEDAESLYDALQTLEERIEALLEQRW